MASNTSYPDNKRSFWASTRLALIVLATTFIANLSITDIALAKKKPWYRFENDHFVAFSNAPEKRARKLLIELEGFRAAFLQIGNITIPENSPKTRVYIVRNKSEFSKLTYSKYAAGFAQRTDDGMILVMPATGDLDWAKTVIRHEYGHALLDYKKFDYPQWYEEGFSEILSVAELSKDGQSFKIGGVPNRAKYFQGPVFDWDALVADDFDPHNITSRSEGSSAYVQAWLLAHYATFGNRLANAYKLQGYFDSIKNGESSPDAFIKAFGTSASELWESELKAYSKRIPVYTFQFVSGVLDANFIRTEAEGTEYQPFIDFLRQRSIARKSGKSPRNPLTELPGKWTQINMTGNCDDTALIAVNEDDHTIMIGGLTLITGNKWESRTFIYQPEKNRAYTLTNVGWILPSQESFSWRLEMRSKSLLCLARSDWDDPQCGVIMRKCSP